MNFMSDPAFAAMIWKVAALAFFGIMYFLLRNPDESHDWWGGLLTRTPLADDPDDAVLWSRILFRWAFYIMLVWVLISSYFILGRFYPALLFREKVEVTGTTEVDQNALPEQAVGAGGGGRRGGPGGLAPMDTTAPAESPTNPTTPDTTAPTVPPGA